MKPLHRLVLSLTVFLGSAALMGAMLVNAVAQCVPRDLNCMNTP